MREQGARKERSRPGLELKEGKFEHGEPPALLEN